MTNIIFLFGTLAGLIIISAIIGVMIVTMGDPRMSDHSEWLGYLIMIVALSMIFFGVKRYRDQELGGVIKFGRAFLVGLGIAIVAGVIYVLVWEVYLVATNYTFFDAYTNAMIEAERAKGVTGEALNASIRQYEAFKVEYQNPLFRMPMTFLEIFPVGLLVALISAALLRNAKVLPAQA